MKAVRNYPEIEEMVILGSRAMGNYKRGSNVDIALKGRNISRTILIRFSYDLNEEYPLLTFDVINYGDILNEELRKHIDEVGKTIYKNGCISSNR